MIYCSVSCLPISIHFCSDSVVTRSEKSMAEKPSDFDLKHTCSILASKPSNSITYKKQGDSAKLQDQLQ